MTQHPDHIYIDALVQNDSALINKIYTQHIGRIRGWIIKNGGDSNDADDIFQEGLTSVYRTAANGNFKLTCPFEAFLFMVCRNKWINMLESRGRKGVTLTDFNGYDGDRLVSQNVDEWQLHEAKDNLFKKKLEALGNACRQLLTVCYTTKSMEEVAIKLGFTYAYVRKKKSECMGQLTEIIRNSPEYKQMRQ